MPAESSQPTAVPEQTSAMLPKLTVLASVLAICSPWPEDVGRCDRKRGDFDECLRLAIEGALAKGEAPAPQIGLRAVDPVQVSELVIGAGSSAVAFSQKYTGMKLYGVSGAKCSSAKVDFDAKTLRLVCSIPSVIMDFKYDINGKILLLPIYGSGPGKIYLDDSTFDLLMRFQEYEKKGEKHFKVVNHELIITPLKIRFDLKNLFGGDKDLGDNIIKVMNDNWKEIFEDVKPSYEDAFGQIFSNIFNGVLQKVTVSELFGDP